MNNIIRIPNINNYQQNNDTYKLFYNEGVLINSH